MIMERKRILAYVGGTVLFAAIVLAVVFLTLHFIPSSQVAATGKKLVIDHDGGADDAMAVFMALLFEKYFDGPQVVALTTSHGNVNETQTFKNSQRFLGISDRKDVSIYRGCISSLVIDQPTDYYFGVDGLGDMENVTYPAIEPEEDHAVLGLIALSKKYEGNLVIVALGALTNIALAIKLDPDFINRLSQLYVGGGHVYGTKSTEPEFNALADVESYHIVANNSNPDKVTFVPFSPILETFNIPKEWRENVLGAIETDTMRALNDFERLSLGRNNKTKWSNLDPVVMALALNSTILEDIKYSEHSIILCDNTELKQRGINTNKFTDNATYANAKVAFAPDQEGYQNLLINIFSAELLRV